MIDIKLGGEAHDITRPEARSQLEILAARPDCLYVACSPPCSKFIAAEGSKVVDACIAIVEARLDHEAGFWIENTTSLGNG